MYVAIDFQLQTHPEKYSLELQKKKGKVWQLAPIFRTNAKQLKRKIKVAAQSYLHFCFIQTIIQ